MTASAFLRSLGLLSGVSQKWTKVGTYLCEVPLRSPMSIFSKSPDLEKCEAGAKE